MVVFDVSNMDGEGGITSTVSEAFIGEVGILPLKSLTIR
jgi:hypothetical protein